MHLSHISTRQTNKIGGISLILMTLFSIFAFGIVLSSIYEPGNTVATQQNILNHESLFWIGNITWVLILLLDLIVAYAFYRSLVSQTPVIALLSGITRLIYTLVFAIGIFGLFLKNIDQFVFYWSWGLIIIGFHLMITGIGVLKTPSIPKILGILLILAGVSYSLIHGIYQIFPTYDALGHTIESIMAIPMTLGELSYGIWLLFKGKS